MDGLIMECEEFLEGYSDFLDGLFEEHRVSYYRTHLLTCPDCCEYDRVMRRGLRLVKELDRPEATPDFVPRLQRRFLDESGKSGGVGEYGRAVLVVGLTTVSLIVIASLPALRPDGGAIQLPPVVVEEPATTDLPSLWGPPPTFAPSASFLRTPDFPRDGLLAPRTQPFSLFRATADLSKPAAETEEVTSQ